MKFCCITTSTTPTRRLPTNISPNVAWSSSHHLNTQRLSGIFLWGHSVQNVCMFLWLPPPVWQIGKDMCIFLTFPDRPVNLNNGWTPHWSPYWYLVYLRNCWMGTWIHRCVMCLYCCVVLFMHSSSTRCLHNDPYLLIWDHCYCSHRRTPPYCAT